MTSFIQTMFVDPFSSPSPFPRSPKPLAPVQTLEQSPSWSYLGFAADAITGMGHKRKRSSESVVLGPLRECLWNLTPPSARGSRGSSPAELLRSILPATPPKQLRSLEEMSRGSPLRSSPLRSPPRLCDIDFEAQGHSEHRGDAPPQPPDGGDHNHHCDEKTDHSSVGEVLTDALYRNSRARGPFRPQKASATKGTSSWQLRQFAEATLGSGSLRKAVKLPEGEDVNEWFAVNGMFRAWNDRSKTPWAGTLTVLVRAVVDFYNQINLLYGSITEFCSPQSCPEMKATDEYVPRILSRAASACLRRRLTSVCNEKIRIPLARFRQIQTTNKDVRA